MKGLSDFLDSPLLSPFYIFLVIADFSDRDKKTIRYT